MTGIIIIVYNIPAEIFILQLAAIKKFCEEDYKIVVVNNSTDESLAEDIRYHTEQNRCMYFRTVAGSKNGSDSHSFAANFAYSKIKDAFTHLFFIDHDCIPVKPFSVSGMLSGGHAMAGLGQAKSKTYMWPGCVMISMNAVDKNIVDFSPNGEFGLDTGGNLYMVIERYGEDHCIFFDETYHENPHFKKPPYNYFSMINRGMFLHFVNSSNWNPVEGNKERINSLINVTREIAGL